MLGTDLANRYQLRTILCSFKTSRYPIAKLVKPINGNSVTPVLEDVYDTFEKPIQ